METRRQNIPTCQREESRLGYRRAVQFLREIQPTLRTAVARQLVGHLLDMENAGHGHCHPWPNQLEDQVLGLGACFSDADECGPGCVITWKENDEISACFDEEMSTLGQNGQVEPAILMMMKLDQEAAAFDREVKQTFDFVAAMLRSLASAAKIVEIIRDMYDCGVDARRGYCSGTISDSRRG